MHSQRVIWTTWFVYSLVESTQPESDWWFTRIHSMRFPVLAPGQDEVYPPAPPPRDDFEVYDSVRLTVFQSNPSQS